jgi:hypothetical protein
MLRRFEIVLVAVALVVPCGLTAQVVKEMTPETIRQAIAYGTKEKNVDLQEISVLPVSLRELT